MTPPKPICTAVECYCGKHNKPTSLSAKERAGKGERGMNLKLDCPVCKHAQHDGRCHSEQLCTCVVYLSKGSI